MDAHDWPSKSFRDHVVSRLRPELRRVGRESETVEVERKLFEKSQNKDEYMGGISLIINHIHCRPQPINNVIPKDNMKDSKIDEEKATWIKQKNYTILDVAFAVIFISMIWILVLF